MHWIRTIRTSRGQTSKLSVTYTYFSKQLSSTHVRRAKMHNCCSIFLQISSGLRAVSLAQPGSAVVGAASRPPLLSPLAQFCSMITSIHYFAPFLLNPKTFSLKSNSACFDLSCSEFPFLRKENLLSFS